MENTLPEPFRNLERFVPQWALAAQNAREVERRRSSREERQAFYDAIVPQLPAILEQLDRYPLDALPEDARRLLRLALSAAEIAPTVELYKGSATVPFSFDETRFIAVQGDRED
jgi:hypothetical protein